MNNASEIRNVLFEHIVYIVIFFEFYDSEFIVFPSANRLINKKTKRSFIPM